MKELPRLSALDLGALLCSRVCHDIISPVGAINNGLELLDEGGDAETREIAMDLIRSSAANASAKLQFARIAFGAAGSAGSEIDTGDAETVARGFFSHERKVTLEWVGTRALMGKNRVKLLLNLLVVAIAAVPKGGNVRAEFTSGDKPEFTVTATGPAARVPPVFLALLGGAHEERLDAHAVQPLYTLMLAAETGMEVTATLTGESVVLRAA
jgi:histidine phosphotransferase ChpT